VLAIVAAIGFVAWLIWELTEKIPIVDLSLFKSAISPRHARLLPGLCVFFANNLLMPLWLQTQVGYTATWAGLVAAPTGVVAVLLTPIAARLMSGSTPASSRRSPSSPSRLLFHARRLHRRCQLLGFRHCRCWCRASR
jgi:hypothetical protein